MSADPRFPPTRHYDVLARLVRQHGWRFGAEVGVLKGRNLFALLDACPGLSMIGVDAWQYRPASDEPGAETYRAHNLAVCAAQVKSKAATYAGRCVILHMDHRAAAAKVEDVSLDFVFLDADHTEAATVEAIRTWLPKVRPGGMMTGHDWEFWPSVRAALDVELPGWQGLTDSVWIREAAA